MIHPMDSAIQHLNNLGLENKLHKILKKKDRRKMITLYYTAWKANIYANKLQYLNHPIKSKLTYKLFI